MKNKQQTIRKIVGVLNNPDEDGGFWLPNIQRPFVWSEDQICRLYDSILREYPISTLLVWKTTSVIRRRKFIDNWKSTLRLSDFYVPEDTKKKCLVLDGQQRLQALFIGLCGSYDGKELFLDILSGELAAPDDVKFKFSFIDCDKAAFPWVKFKDLIFSTKKKRQVLEGLRAQAGRDLTEIERNKLEDHIDRIDQTFKMDDAVSYQELDSIDNPTLYGENDVVEIFIRANSGGTKLGKSDLLFSLLGTKWGAADEMMDDLLDSLNQHGFSFDRDFVLKTALTVLDKGARYEVGKFRKEGVREEVQARWEDISAAIQDVLDLVRGKSFIQCDRALPTYLVLIPLVYTRYHYPGAWKRAKEVDTYLLRCSLSGAFGFHSDEVIDGLVKKVNELKAFDVDEMFGVLRSQKRSLEITEEQLWQMGYGSATIYLLFNLWYRSFNYTPAYDNNLPQVDHIFPQSRLRKVKAQDPQTGRIFMKYPEAARNQLANCMLLTKKENGAGGKGDMPPADWFRQALKLDNAYLDKHLIPADPSLWALERFDDFIAARQQLIREKFGYLLVATK